MPALALTATVQQSQNLWQKMGDLTIQSVLLQQLLQDGFSELLVMGYAVFMGINALSVAASILLGNQSALNEILIDSLCVFPRNVACPLQSLC
jgi:hypothetical protein